MRKYFVVLIMVMLAATAWAAGDSFTDYKGTISVYGYPGTTKIVHVDNTTKTIQGLYEAGGGTWLGGQFTAHAPIGMFLTCATTATHWAFGNDNASATVGHVLPADGSWHFVNPFWMSTGSAYGAAASDNVTCNMTPEY